MVSPGLFAKVDSNFQLVTRSSLIANTAGAQSASSVFPNDLQCFPIKIRFLWVVLYQEHLTIYISDKVVDFLFFLQKQYEFYLKLTHFAQQVTHRPIPASQENKKICNNFIRTMCFALEYFIINIKPPSPIPTPTLPL